ncbi:MAG: MFS transporter [Archangium sp.]|nr:MFS transporter [Archangium sp.]
MTAPGYFELLRTRPNYRALWLGSVVSLAGDWFTLIALYNLLEEYTGSSEAVGLMLTARFLPPAFLSPMAGVVADRFSRKHVMVLCDLLRAVVVFGFLLVRTREDVWLVYALTFAQMSLAAFFDPAEQASIGSTVEPHEVVTANTLQGATWSAMLGVGAVAGGLLTTMVGRDASFVVDALSYLLSAFFISRAVVPRPVQPPAAKTLAGRLGFTDLLEGLALVRARPEIRRVLWVKTGWGITGGAALMLYAVMGRHVFGVPGSPDAGVGVLLGMRGIGALIGPLIARRFGGDGPPFLERAIGWAFVVTALFWALFAFSPNLVVAAICLSLAHMGVATQWVFSSSLINLRVEDRFRGRVFAVDSMFFLVVLGFSSWAGGKALDAFHIQPRALMASLSVILLGSGAIWWWLLRRPPSPPRGEGDRDNQSAS